MNQGFVDWITATGANMYHDLHFAFNLPMHRGSHVVDDVDLRDKGVCAVETDPVGLRQFLAPSLPFYPMLQDPAVHGPDHPDAAELRDQASFLRASKRSPDA